MEGRKGGAGREQGEGWSEGRPSGGVFRLVQPHSRVRLPHQARHVDPNHIPRHLLGRGLELHGRAPHPCPASQLVQHGGDAGVVEDLGGACEEGGARSGATETVRCGEGWRGRQREGAGGSGGDLEVALGFLDLRSKVLHLVLAKFDGRSEGATLLLHLPPPLPLCEGMAMETLVTKRKERELPSPPSTARNKNAKPQWRK